MERPSSYFESIIGINENYNFNFLVISIFRRPHLVTREVRDSEKKIVTMVSEARPD